MTDENNLVDDEETRKKPKQKLILYITIGIVVLLGIILLLVNSIDNKVVCNSPYIQIEDSCCLDENYNNICDRDETEEIEEINIWELDRFSIDGKLQE